MTDEQQYLASLDDLATLTGADSDDPKLRLALRRASDRFITAIGWDPTYKADDPITLEGTGGQTLLLPVMHVTDIKSVTVDDTQVTDWTADKESGILRRRHRWHDELGNITVVCSHGWVEIPGGIADAILEQAEAQYRSISGIQSYSLGGRSITFGAATTVGVTQKWSDAVNRYSLGGRV